MESQEKIFNFFGINILRMQKFKGLWRFSRLKYPIILRSKDLRIQEFSHLRNRCTVNNIDYKYHYLGVNLPIRKKNILKIYILEFLGFCIFKSL